MSDPLLCRGEPSPRDPSWLKRINAPLPAGDRQRLRVSVERDRPFGSEERPGQRQ
jgi:hypothetical protein